MSLIGCFLVSLQCWINKQHHVTVLLAAICDVIKLTHMWRDQRQRVSHLVTLGFLSGWPGSSLSSSASRPPRWPAGLGFCQSDLDKYETSHKTVSATGTVALNYVSLYGIVYPHDQTSLVFVYELHWPTYMSSNHEIQAIHSVTVDFTSAALMYCSQSRRKSMSHDTFAGLDWPLFLFLHSQTDAWCGLPLCVQPDLSHVFTSQLL